MYIPTQLLSYIASMILRHVYLVPGLFIKPDIFNPVLAIHYHGDVDISMCMCKDCRDSVPNIAAVSLSCCEAKHLSPCSPAQVQSTVRVDVQVKRDLESRTPIW